VGHRSYHLYPVLKIPRKFANFSSLCGFPPFYGEDDDDAFDQIISGKFEFPEPYWSKISENAKDLIRKLLVVNPNKRFTAKQALDHPWIKDINANVHLSTTLEQLKKFNAKKRWKKGINTVIAAGRFQWTAQRVLKKGQKKIVDQ
jgi:serine/threonine protein kinase